MRISEQRRLKELLGNGGESVSTAESCTGGRIAHLITTIPGSSEYFVGGAVTYSAAMKHKLLGVPMKTILKKGIVSSEVAAAMSRGIRAYTGSTYAIATTGWADRYGDSHEPEGTVWIGIDGPLGTRTFRVHNEAETGEKDFRNKNIRNFAAIALQKLNEYISENKSTEK